MKKSTHKRTQEFLENLGNGKSLPEIEAKNQDIDNYLFKKEEPENAI